MDEVQRILRKRLISVFIITFSCTCGICGRPYYIVRPAKFKRVFELQSSLSIFPFGSERKNSVRNLQYGPRSWFVRGINHELCNNPLFFSLSPQLTVVRQRDKLEGWFKHFLVEDKGVNPVAHSYVDFLCQMHKEIRNLMN